MPRRDSAAQRVAVSATVLNAQMQALNSGRLDRFEASWAPGVPGARRQGRTIARNLRTLRASLVSSRVLASSIDGATVRSPAPHLVSWTLGADVTWRLAGTDTRPVTTRLAYTFVSLHGAVFVSAVTAPDAVRAPVWLLPRIHVRSGPRVVAVAHTAADAAALFRRLLVAWRDVHDVLPGWRGRLTAYLPATPTGFDRLLGAGRGAYGAVAAVTTTLDGSTGPPAPVAIVVNPHVWPLLRPVGARVVITHEATHVATASIGSTAPLWLTEGFADYVAVRAAGVPDTIAAGSALRAVRRRGAPDRLPADRDFAATSPSLETSYELSRLVMQTVARHHGLRRLVHFYRDAVTHPADLRTAMRRDLHASPQQLTRQWRRLLVRLAGAH